MDVTKLYAELQTNPKNIVIYRRLAEHYKSCNKHNESAAFTELIKRITDVNSSNPNKK